MSFCTNCGTQVQEGIKFCTNCGNAMQGEQKKIPCCSKCGNEIAENLKFCTTCGTPAALAATAMAAQTVENLSLWGYFIKCWKNYANFEGRARRKEYWGWCLFMALFSGLIQGISFASGSLAFQWLFILVALLPSCAVYVRRAHDLGKNGWYILPIILLLIFSFIPGLLTSDWAAKVITSYFICSIVLGCVKGKAKKNKYGPSPK